MPVALTFDDGPDPDWTPELLATLGRMGARATFFVQGERLVQHPEIAREAVAAGHELQPHCFHHDSHRELSDAQITEDIERLLDALRAHAGVEEPTLWRPPYGHIRRPATYEVAKAHGLEVVTWTLNTCDWGAITAEAMWKDITDQDRPMSALEEDSIVLMHDFAGEQLVPLLEKLIPEIHGRDWEIEPMKPGANTPEEAWDDCQDLRATAG
ncbi:MAG TPA: polysaccharide deacetylase family protein [Thermoleophilaceae bacterium]|nr:polysaccharide deacetylase family protein [Thermoleophilaceae bacterium]